MKDTWKDYFSFNKRERRGILILASFITILIIYLFIADYFPLSNKPVDFSSFKAELTKEGVTSVPGTKENNVPGPLVNINTADTTQLMKLPRMTSYCARMLVRYRQKLGGYYNIKQLSEVWGMDSSMFKAIVSKIYADSNSIQRININSADIKQLACHPYIHYYLAKAIVNYRGQHGLFKSLAGLHKMAAIDDSTFNRIVPYLTVNGK